ncbi:MAG: hypothetical protein GY805_22385 [Chloroflexi bacterium]|nr:hypothetical protein [Chloroflexota bacterium]
MKINQHPSFPRSMVLFAFSIVVVGVSLTLAGQPLEYWLDFSRAVSAIPWVREALIVHPLLFAALTIVYLISLGLLFKMLAKPHSLVLWIAVCFIHSRYAIFDLSHKLERFISIQNNIRYSIEFGLFVLFLAILGLFLARMLRTEQLIASSEAQLLPVKSWRIVFWTAVPISAVWLVTLVILFMNTLNILGATWYPILPEHRPESVSYTDLAYDVNRQKAVLFGGQVFVEKLNSWPYINETWEWDGVDWVQRLPENSPSARVKHTMAYDPGRSVVVLFGGLNESGDLADVWEWDGEDWEEKRPSYSPPARCCHGMFYDPQRGRTVIYGGINQDGQFFNDAWEWDGLEWSPIYFEGTQPYSSGNDIVYFEAANYSVLPPNWLWKPDGWVAQQSEVTPGKRQHEGLAYDPVYEHMILFGGLQDDEVFDDTWLLTQDGWQRLDLQFSPSRRKGHLMFYDQTRGRIVLFGGTDEGVFNDMWELSLPDVE